MKRKRADQPEPVTPFAEQTRVQPGDTTQTVLMRHVLELLHDNKDAYRDMREAMNALITVTHEQLLATREQAATNREQLTATRANTAATGLLTDELAALRLQRSKGGGNGHAKDDSLDDNHDEGNQ